jgi:ribose transport system substrate-binding protein
MCLTLLLFLFAFLMAVGCAGTNNGNQLTLTEKTITAAGTASPKGIPTDQPKVKTIALVMKTLTNPFFVEMEKGARQAERELGIRLVVKTAAQETSIEQQIGIVNDLIQAKVDAIVIAPGDSVELIPVLKKAQDTGIAIVNIDNQLDTDYSKKLGLVNVPFISVDNVQGAYLSAKYVADKVSGKSKAGIIEGIRGARNATDRKSGAEQAFTENNKIRIVASETANWKIDEADTVVKRIFDEYPDIRVLFCANDMMALGAIKRLDEIKRSDVLIAGFDALDEAKDSIRNGKLQVTIDQQAARQGYLGVTTAVKLLNGHQVPANTMVDVVVISKENLK